MECWLEKNKCIFQGKELNIGLVSHQIRMSYGEICTPHQQKKSRRILDPVLDFTKYWGYFDGASQGKPGKCGAGILLYLTKSQFFA